MRDLERQISDAKVSIARHEETAAHVLEKTQAEQAALVEMTRLRDEYAEHVTQLQQSLTSMQEELAAYERAEEVVQELSARLQEVEQSKLSLGEDLQDKELALREAQGEAHVREEQLENVREDMAAARRELKQTQDLLQREKHVSQDLHEQVEHLKARQITPELQQVCRYSIFRGLQLHDIVIGVLYMVLDL